MSGDLFLCKNVSVDTFRLSSIVKVLSIVTSSIVTGCAGPGERIGQAYPSA